MDVFKWCNICQVLLTDYGYYNSDGETVLLILILLISSIVSIILAIIMLVCLWRIFKRAGKPGWASIVPFYNYYCLTEIPFIFLIILAFSDNSYIG